MHSFHDNGRLPLSADRTSRHTPRSPRLCGGQLPSHERPWPGGISSSSEPYWGCFDDFTLRFIRAKVRQLIGRAGIKESDREDLIQDFSLNLLRRKKHFDPALGTWEAFVIVTCQNRLANILEHRKARMRSREREAGSLDDTPSVGKRGDIGSTVPESQQDRRTGRRTRSHEESQDLMADVAAVVSKFPPRLRELCRRIMAGTSKAAAAKELGMSQPELYEVLGRIRARFENAGLRGYL